MDKKKPQVQGQKAGVKFADQNQEQVQPENQKEVNQQKPKITYKSAEECKEIALNVFAEVETSYKGYIQNDPNILHQDTAQSLKSLLDDLRDLLMQLNLGTFDDKQKNYYLTFNTTIYLLDLTRLLRQSVYSAITVDYLATAIISLEGNIILLNAKYLDWRVKLYIELSHVYEEIGSLSSANNTIERCMGKIEEIKEIEYQDEPVPDYIQKIFNNNIKLVQIMDLKLKLQNQLMTVDAWKKRVIELFEKDQSFFALGVVECLRVNNKKYSNTVEKSGKSLPWKEAAVQSAYDIFKGDIETIAQALEQLNEKMTRQVEFRTKTINIDEEARKDLVQKNRDQDSSMVKEKTWKEASSRIPLEYHIELIHYTFEANNTAAFDELVKYALVRCKFRRLEIPYINDIDFLLSLTPNPNIPNGYEKIPIDINEASLRMELSKLRNKNKKKQKQESSETQIPQGKDQKKGAGKQSQQQQQQANQQQQKESQDSSEDNKNVQATAEELNEIKHEYVYIIVKKSADPERAIFGLDIKLGEEGVKPVVAEGNIAIEIPVKQYTGVQEQTHQTSWMQIKYSIESLKEEEEKKTLITDIRPIFGRNPQIRPDLGYNKVDLDLRQTPKEFIRTPNMEYVYITYKTDKQYYNNERELYLLMSFNELENSFKVEKPMTLPQEKPTELELTYSLDKMQQLATVFKQILDGPLGEQFIEDRIDFLMNLCFYIWKKYIRNQLYQFQFVQELKVMQEISEADYREYQAHILKAKPIYIQLLKIFNQILLRNQNNDIIWVCKINIELCKLLEEVEEYKQAIQNLRFCLNQIILYRDYQSERGVQSQKDMFLPMLVTCSNQKIQETITKMKESYIDRKNKLNKEIRRKARLQKAQQYQLMLKLQQQQKEKEKELDLQDKALEYKRVGSVDIDPLKQKTGSQRDIESVKVDYKKVQILDDEQECEEEYEYLDAALTFQNDDNKDSQYFTSLDSKSTKFSETEMVINAMHADILINLFRCMMKDGRQMHTKEFIKNKTMQSMKEDKSEIYMTKTIASKLQQIPYGENLDGLPDREKLKTTIMQSETAQTIKSNHQQLKTTLQKAEKLPPDIPVMKDYETFLTNEVNENPYEQALLYMMLAMNKNKEPDQQYYLEKAQQCIIESDNMEQTHLDNAVQDSIFIFSTLLDNKETKCNSKYFFPFDQLYKPKYIQKTKVPRKPILIARNSHSITMKLPPFSPIIPEELAKQYPTKEQITTMALFGKESAFGVNVSKTCNDLDIDKLGTRNELGSVLTIRNLTINHKYCFAALAYDGDAAESNDIGQTGEDIVCLHPLPINLLSSYLAKIAYQVGDFVHAEQAADHTISYFTEKSEFLDDTLGYKDNCLYVLRLKQPIIKDVSILEIQNLTETFIIKARCLKRTLFQRGDKGETLYIGNETPIQHQKNILTVGNYLLLALETCMCANNYKLAKKISIEIYNLMYELLLMRQKTTLIFHIMLKGSFLISTIPKQYWDQNLRIVSAKYCYEIVKMSIQFNQANLGKRMLYSQIKLFNRKWYTFSYQIMIQEEGQEQIKKDDKKQAKKDNKKDVKKDSKKGGAGQKQESGQQPTQEQLEEEQIKMVPKLMHQLFESTKTVQNYLQEALLTFPHDLGDYVQKFIEQWKELIEQYLPFVDNSPEQKEQIISQLSVFIDYIDIFKDISTAQQKLQTLKQSPLYFELSCNVYKRLLQHGYKPNTVFECIQNMGDIPLTDIIKLELEVKDLKMQAIGSDTEWYPRKLGQLKKEKETNKVGDDKTIQIFTDYFNKGKKLLELKEKEDTSPESLNKFQRYDYLNIYLSELNLLKAVTTYLMQPSSKQTKEMGDQIYYNVFLLSVDNILDLKQQLQQRLQAQSQLANSQGTQQQQTSPDKKDEQKSPDKKDEQKSPDKKEEQKSPDKKDAKEQNTDKKDASLQQQQGGEKKDDGKINDQLQQFVKFLSMAAFHSVQARTWFCLQNIIKTLYNVMVNNLSNPAQHFGTEMWQHLSLICYCSIEMIEMVRKEGFYHKKLELEERVSEPPERQLQTKLQEEEAKQKQIQEQLEAQKKQRQQSTTSAKPEEAKSGQENKQDVQGTTKQVKFDENLNKSSAAENQKMAALQWRQNRVNYEDEKDYDVGIISDLVELPKLERELTKEFWFHSIKELQVDVIANIIGYTVQVLMVEEKWNTLISISRSFCNATQHYYSQYILPFTIYAQQNLIVLAEQQVNEKKKELDARVAKFQEWDNYNKSKNKRSAKYNQNEEEEVKKYKADRAELDRQLNLRQDILSFNQQEKKKSEEVIEEILRDFKQEYLDLSKIRKKIRDLGNKSHDHHINKFQQELFDVLSLKSDKTAITVKPNKVSANNLQQELRSLQDTLAKKNEVFHTIQARQLLGNLYYFSYSYSSAEDIWKDVINTIFQNPDCYKNFRQAIQKVEKDGQPMAHKLGIKQMMIGINVLNNITQFCTSIKDLSQYRESLFLAAELGFGIFRVSLPHPQLVAKYNTYRLEEICIQKDIFNDVQVLDPAESVIALERLSWNLFDIEHHLKTLPLLCLMDYIATDILQSSFYSMRAKILKSIALSNVGMINESYIMLQKVINEKDLNIQWIRPSEYNKREFGCNWFYSTDSYDNSSHPQIEQNKSITEQILAKMDLPKQFASKYGQLNVNLYSFARASLVVAINEYDIFEKSDMNEVRAGYLKRAEQIIRTALKKISLDEELEYLMYYIQQLGVSQDDQLQKKQEVITKYQEQIQQLFVKHGIVEKNDQHEYFLCREESIPYYQKREERLLMIARYRYLLHKSFLVQNLFNKCYVVLKNTIWNIQNYCQELRQVETGEDKGMAEIDNLKLQPDEAVQGKGGKGQQQQKGGSVQDKKDSKKSGKDQKDQKNEEEDTAESNALAKQKSEEEQQKWWAKAQERKTRRHLNGFWLIKLKIELCSVLYNQNKYEEANSLIDAILQRKRTGTKFEQFDKIDKNSILKDNYFLKILDELTVKIQLKLGKFQYNMNISNKFDETIQFSKNNFLIDARYAQLLGDYGEIVFSHQNFKGALPLFKEAMDVADQLLAEFGYDYNPQNYNQKSLNEGVSACQELQLTAEQEEEILLKIDRSTGATKGQKKDDKKGKEDSKQQKKGADKKQAQKQQQQEEATAQLPINPLNPYQNVNLLQDPKYNFSVIDAEQLNNTKLIYNLYQKYIVLYMRSALRWINCLFEMYPTSDDESDNIIKLLKKLEIIKRQSKTFLIPVSLRIELSLMFAKYYKRKFIFNILKIQNHYIKVYEQCKRSKEDKQIELAKQYKSLALKKPYRDLCRNKYLIETPNFSQKLKEELLLYLENENEKDKYEDAKSYFDEIIKVIEGGECLLLENNRKIEDIYMEIAEMYVYKREYMPRSSYKYIDIDEYQEKLDILKNSENQDQQKVDKYIQQLQKDEQIKQQKMELQIYKNLLQAINATLCKNEITHNFQTLGQNNLADSNKLSQDLQFQIIESDTCFYQETSQFTEEKRKKNINTIDVLLFMKKLANESKIMTFSQEFLQNQITKINKYLLSTAGLPQYQQSCVIQNIEAQAVNENSFIFKSQFIQSSQEYKFIYMLGPLNKSKIKCVDGLTPEEISKIILNEEKDILYGNFYINEQELDQLLKSALDIQKAIEISNQKSQAARDRDFKQHKVHFQNLIESFSHYFFLSERQTQAQKKKSIEQEEDKQDQVSILGNRFSFIPDLKPESIGLFVNLFNEIGLKSIDTKEEQQVQPQKGGATNTQAKGGKGKQDQQQQQQEEKLVFTNENINANLLAIFRFLHQKKYK